MRPFRLIAFTFVAAFAASGSQAHDFLGMSHDSAQRSMQSNAALDPKYSALSETTRSVISRLALWNPGDRLVACFYEGSPAVRAKIATLAGEWTKNPAVNIAIDFGEGPGFRSCSGRRRANGRYEDIRIGFRAPSGDWSYVGIDSHQPGLGAEPSMNLFNFDRQNPDSTDRDYVVLHEFGHALGLEHEHQSPGTTCEAEFDLEAIRTGLNWTDDMMRRNFKTLETNSRKFEWSAYDPESIMMYALPTIYFKQGIPLRCRVPLNTKLSTEDQRAIQRAYPRVVSTGRPPSRAIEAEQVLAIGGLPSALKERAALSKALAE